MRKFKMLAGAAALATLAGAVPAQAVVFVLTDTGGTAQGTLARRGFQVATDYWASVLRDNVTINLNIGFSALPTGVLGSTGSARSLLSMQQGYTALALDATSALDFQSVASLQPLGVSAVSPAFGAVTFTTNAFNDAGNGYIDTATRVDNDGSVNNSTLAITKASAKALGLTTDVNGAAINYGTADGSISFSTGFKFDFDPTDGIDADAFDFIGVAIHEIGHALGFVSGVDSFDGRTVASPATAGRGNLEGLVVASQLDLFRYSAPGRLDWSTQNTPYFSVDGGANQLYGDSRFSQGVNFGDGRQASHFKDSPPGPQLGNLDPTSARGQMQEVTGLDLAAFDVIGYNLNAGVGGANYRYSTADAFRAFVAPVPEPAVWLQMILGFGALGGVMRQRRRRTTIAFA